MNVEGGGRGRAKGECGQIRDDGIIRAKDEKKGHNIPRTSACSVQDTGTNEETTTVLQYIEP